MSELHQKKISEIIWDDKIADWYDGTISPGNMEDALKQWAITEVNELKMGKYNYSELLPSIPFSIKHAEEEIKKGSKPKEMFEHQIIVNRGIIDFLIDRFEITEEELK